VNIVQAANLACPIDGQRLVLNDKQWGCGNGHVFDVARQGYVNLLAVQHKRSKYPGDSKAMVLARAQFLNAGFYEPIAETLADITLAQLENHNPENNPLENSLLENNKKLSVLDAGCGEGYYLDYAFNYLKSYDSHSADDLSFIGLDISKAAIAVAAKRNKQIAWIVGTNRQPPVEEASVDCILCVFGFQHLEGFKKILKPGGKVMLVEPGPNHLQEMREIIYSDVKRSGPSDLCEGEQKEFSIVDQRSLQFKTGVINNEQINHLLSMTPHFYRATTAAREAVKAVQAMDLSADIVFRVLAKSN